MRRTRSLAIALLTFVALLAAPAAWADKPDSAGLFERVKQLEMAVVSLTATNARLTARVEGLEAILQFVSVETGPINGLAGPNWIIEGANVHVRSGSGSTDEEIATAVKNGVVKMNVDTDTQWA